MSGSSCDLNCSNNWYFNWFGFPVYNGNIKIIKLLLFFSQCTIPNGAWSVASPLAIWCGARSRPRQRFAFASMWRCWSSRNTRTRSWTTKTSTSPSQICPPQSLSVPHVLPLWLQLYSCPGTSWSEPAPCEGATNCTAGYIYNCKCSCICIWLCIVYHWTVLSRLMYIGNA